MKTDMPLTDASDSQLAAAVEGNLFALFRAMMVLPGSEIVETEALSYHLAFPSNPMFKGVWGTKLATDEADSIIDKTLDWFKARNAPFIFWWVGSWTRPDDLPVRLESHGFALNIEGDPGMAVNFHDLDEHLHTPEGFTIIRAITQKQLEDWRDVFCASYEIPAFAGQAWVDATLKVGAEKAAWQPYIGYWNEKPVATNILFNGAGVASVYGVGTLPEARGKGIGRAITLQPFLDARAQGYHYGVLFATEMGYPVYKKMGFRDVNCKIGRYMWVNG